MGPTAVDDRGVAAYTATDGRCQGGRPYDTDFLYVIDYVIPRRREGNGLRHQEWLFHRTRRHEVRPMMMNSQQQWFVGGRGMTDRGRASRPRRTGYISRTHAQSAVKGREVLFSC